MTATAPLELVPLDELSRTLRGFYVPQFEIKVAGAGLPNDVILDVIDLSYEDDLDQMDSFNITVSNYDEVQRKYKYIGSEDTTATGAGAQGQTEQGSSETNRYQLFEPCSKKVTIKMGYLGDLKQMMTGFFTTMEPSFSSNGASTLSVRGINVLQRFRTKKYSDFFENKTPSQIAEAVGRRRDNRANALRLPINIITNPPETEQSIPYLAQKNEYSIEFLWKLARREGYVLSVVEPEDERGDISLRFAPSEENDTLAGSAYDLKLGQSLIELTPRITTANQFRSVTVNSWDRRRQRAISATATIEDREFQRMNADLHYMTCMCDPREELVVDEPHFNQRQAERRARALLLDQQKQMVTVTGTTVGLPLLRSGTKVQISEVGARLSGTYFVTKTTHTFNDSGYITKFEGRREQVTPAGEVRECRT